MARLLRWLGVVLALLLAVPQAARAQALHWNERHTLQFSILYPDGSSAAAEQYAGFVDGIYEEHSRWWGYRADTPIILRLYPTMAAYEQVNPAAGVVSGIIAHAHTGRREISVALPQTVGQTPTEIENNVRHELAHIIAADLSGGRLTTLWQEGIAQNAELPAPELEAKISLLRQVIAADQLMTWSTLDQRAALYSRPEIGYPESYTIVAFLLRRSDMATFRRFVEASKRSASTQAALETTYGVPMAQLEQEWRAGLAEFVAGGYQTPPAPTFDLDSAQSQIEQGNYDAAAVALAPLIPQFARQPRTRRWRARWRSRTRPSRARPPSARPRRRGRR